MSGIEQSLLITAIGMGLVFILILLLWGLMGVMVSITNRYDFMAQAEEKSDSPKDTKSESGEKIQVDKSNLVAIAVAAALATGKKAFHIPPVQPSATSSWQAVTRASTLSQISAIFNRKPRG